MENLVLLHFLDIFMTVLRIFLHLPELYFSHTEQPVNKKSGGTKMMNRLFKRGMVIALDVYKRQGFFQRTTENWREQLGKWRNLWNREMRIKQN